MLPRTDDIIIGEQVETDMANMDEITQSLKGIANRIAIDVKRTTAVTRLRMQLTGLDRQRHEQYAKIGSHLNELRRTNQVNDPVILRLLEPEFENLDRIEKRIHETMDSIQELNLHDPAEPVHATTDHDMGKSGENEQNLLDSFDVH